MYNINVNNAINYIIKCIKEVEIIEDRISVDISDSDINDLGLMRYLFGVEEINDFKCISCNKLESLKGGPRRVSGVYDCSNCFNLKTIGYEIESANDFICMNCESLTSLNGVPKIVDKFCCIGCINLNTLEDGVMKANIFECDNCVNIKNLRGMPNKVKSLSCRSCDNLSSLDGCADIIDGDFDCSYCNILLNFIGGPKVVRGNFICERCMNLSSLDGLPKIKGHLKCIGCYKLEYIDDKYIKRVGGYVYINKSVKNSNELSENFIGKVIVI